MRELRNNVASVLRRAADGERIVITVNGEAVAQLGPIEAVGTPTLEDLVATGLVHAPHHAGMPAAELQPVDLAVDVRLDDVLALLPRGPVTASLLAVDTSALARRYLRTAGHGLVTEAMDEHPVWCASALARAETLQVLHHVSVSRPQHDTLWDALRADWDRFHVVPVDERCLAAAVEIGATYRVRSTDAIHLAAAARLPQPVSYLTFDRRQIPAAAGLGFEVIAPTEA